MFNIVLTIPRILANIYKRMPHIINRIPSNRRFIVNLPLDIGSMHR